MRSGHGPLQVFQGLLDGARRGVDHRVGTGIEVLAACEDAADVFQRLVHGAARLLGAVAGVERPQVALRDHNGYSAKVAKRFSAMGCSVESVHTSGNPKRVVAEAGAFFIGGGNTFRLLKTLQDLDLVDAIRERVRNGAPYIGSSAGSNVAGLTIKTTNDMPVVWPPNAEALGLVPFQINPHYVDGNPPGVKPADEKPADKAAEKTDKKPAVLPKGEYWPDEALQLIRDLLGEPYLFHGDVAAVPEAS